MDSNQPPLLVASVFMKTLAVVLLVAGGGLIVANWLFGPLPVRDIVGTAISAPIFAYMVHLWIVYSKEN